MDQMTISREQRRDALIVAITAVELGRPGIGLRELNPKHADKIVECAEMILGAAEQTPAGADRDEDLIPHGPTATEQYEAMVAKAEERVKELVKAEERASAAEERLGVDRAAFEERFKELEDRAKAAEEMAAEIARTAKDQAAPKADAPKPKK